MVKLLLNVHSVPMLSAHVIELSHSPYEQPGICTLPLKRELAAKCGAAFLLQGHYVLLEFLFTLM